MKTAVKILLGGLVCLACTVSLSLAATLYVDINNPTPVAPYSSWATAANDIQTAVDAAVSNDTVIIADGTYTITSQLSINKCLTMKSVNGPDVTIVDADGNCRVFNLNSNNGAIVLEGFTITGGYADYDAAHGGGIYAAGNNSICIIYCIVEDNAAPVNGGGIHVRSKSTTEIESSTFRNNFAGRSGGGIYVTQNNRVVVITNCVVVGNYSEMNGGGIDIRGDDTTIRKSQVSNNQAGLRGGGIYVSGSGYRKVEDSIIKNNSATAKGGGIGGGSQRILRCVIANNHSDGTGGGLDFKGLIADSLIVGNNSGDAGGGIKTSSTSDIINCTVVGNHADSTGGGVNGGDLFNSIVWNNTAVGGPDIYASDPIYNSCSYGLVPGLFGNINNDPEFLHPGNGNYRLSATSPCIDAGTNGYVSSMLDLDDNLRIMDGDFDGNPKVDMGAYEFPVIGVLVDVKPGSDTNPINMKSKGRTPVAVLATETFDISEINIDMVRFAGAGPVHHAFEDVDCNGDIDLILQFKTPELNLYSTTTLAILLGQTHGGELLGGSDSVVVKGGTEPPYPPPPPAPEFGLALISAGINAGTDPDFGWYYLKVDAFHIAETDTSIEAWNEVCAWAITNGYSFTNPGRGKGPGHPVSHVSWYDCAKWCNALSEMEGLDPCYTVGGVVYRGGQAMPVCDFAAIGYRLPTNIEWKYAARGGLVGKRFAWGNRITHADANYNSAGGHLYDLSAHSGYHPAYYNGGEPYTSPVGSFSPNGYGLYDVSGNLREWVDVTVGSVPSLRGGAWIDQADYNRIGPSLSYGPTFADRSVGFRVAQTVVTE